MATRRRTQRKLPEVIEEDGEITEDDAAATVKSVKR